jgi:hypothetical protein
VEWNAENLPGAGTRRLAQSGRYLSSLLGGRLPLGSKATCQILTILRYPRKRRVPVEAPSPQQEGSARQMPWPALFTQSLSLARRSLLFAVWSSYAMPGRSPL